jgi:hypothetical protein
MDALAKQRILADYTLDGKIATGMSTWEWVQTTFKTGCQGVIWPMYNISLFGIIDMNPPPYNEYILIKNYDKKIRVSGSQVSKSV